MFDIKDWDAINLDSIKSFIKREERGVMDDLKQKLDEGSQKINDAATNAANSVANTASDTYNSASDKISNATGKIGDTWDNVKVQYEDTKEKLETIQKILRLVPYIFGLMFIMFIAIIIFGIVLIVKHKKRNEEQRQQIDELARLIKNIDKKLTPGNSTDETIADEFDDQKDADVVDIAVKGSEPVKAKINNKDNIINCNEE